LSCTALLRPRFPAKLMVLLLLSIVVIVLLDSKHLCRRERAQKARDHDE
jgi:hypothetical protein